jgi:hypothetical protein
LREEERSASEERIQAVTKEEEACNRIKTREKGRGRNWNELRSPKDKQEF